MTIPFAPTPVTGGSDPADARASFSNVAQVTDANFARINTSMRSMRPVLGVSHQAAVVASPVIGAWTDFAPAAFASVILVLPARVRSLWMGIGGWVGGPSYTGMTLRIGGATTYVVGPEANLLAGGQTVAVGRQYMVPASALTPGGTVTVTPRYFFSETPTADIILAAGVLWAVALC